MTFLAIVGAVLAVIVSALTIWRFLAPGIKRSNAVADAILGKEQVTDRAGGIISEKELGLVQRTSTLEQLVGTLVTNDLRLASLEESRANHETRLTSLERNQDERIEIRRESANLLGAIRERDTIDGDVDE